MQFVIDNWYLFLALIVVLSMLIGGPIRQSLLGISSIPIAQAIQLVNRQAGVIVDVREPDEFKGGHIPRAINLPLSALKSRLNELEKYKNKPVVVCCRSGQRSAQAAVTLRKQGFNAVHNLSGGFSAWQRDNLPTES